MQSATALPGFEHLLEVCRSRAHPMKLESPSSSGPPAEPSVAGQPMDSQLAAVHARMGFLWVRDELSVFPARHERRPDLHRVNAHWRQEWAEPFGSLLVFARDDRLAYCYATVPTLVDARGLQPVVWVDVYEALYAVPVASSVDRFFDTYACYLEAASVSGEEDGPPLRTFPWSAFEVIARDRELVERIRAGHFDFLLQANARAREWVERLPGVSVRR
ncbi:hypothetical protein [Vitiosangium sp. GDMCC 1.1324]|uniref:hypothetical protein n=1 Tax=Vitiosangium sp. (strain GDMCC 1.1324) TaxID=2138576 RepID=UPI000D3A2066|nr:hypothetical protein [Vitiosangium sp. GDMCC 1.1324]PTL84239.1 hypothetical protein DAT35_12470 [Vitiosangium sp. GDMCC 1.1324]